METQGVLAKMSAAIIEENKYTPISCVMYYHRGSPFEVVFSSAEGTASGEIVEWHYGRDLIKAAIEGEDRQIHGEGDVILSKEDGFVFTMFQSHEGRCLVAFISADMEKFLALTEDLVPFGEEPEGVSDLDDALREFLGE
jgi:hypothetical protein